jgi:hypothetical protein
MNPADSQPFGSIELPYRLTHNRSPMRVTQFRYSVRTVILSALITIALYSWSHESSFCVVEMLEISKRQSHLQSHDA